VLDAAEGLAAGLVLPVRGDSGFASTMMRKPYTSTISFMEMPFSCIFR